MQEEVLNPQVDAWLWSWEEKPKLGISSETEVEVMGRDETI